MRQLRASMVAVAVLACLAASACDSGSSSDPDPPDAKPPLTPYDPPGIDEGRALFVEAPDDPGWSVLDLDASVRAIDDSYTGLTVLAVDEVGPVLLRTRPFGAVPIGSEVVSGLDHPHELSEYADYVIATDADPASGRPVAVAGGDSWESSSSFDAPVDDAGRKPSWFWAGVDGNETLQQVGLVPGAALDDPWRLQYWVDRRNPAPIAPDSAPYAAPGTSLEADAVEGYAFVAGPISARPPEPGTAPPSSLWIGPSDFAPRGTWQEVGIVPPLDRVTDVSCWSLGCWVAGVRDGRVVVHDYDDGDGRPMRMPRIPVADDATVIVAGQPIGRPIVIAVESEGSVDVWRRPDRGGRWTRLDAPDGELTGALVRSPRIVLVVGERLWRARMSDLT